MKSSRKRPASGVGFAGSTGRPKNEPNEATTVMQPTIVVTSRPAFCPDVPVRVPDKAVTIARITIAATEFATIPKIDIANPYLRAFFAAGLCLFTLATSDEKLTDSSWLAARIQCGTYILRRAMKIDVTTPNATYSPKRASKFVNVGAVSQ
jgi:hypothetical protein